MGLGGWGEQRGPPLLFNTLWTNVSNTDFRSGGCRLAGTVNNLVLPSCFEELLPKLLLRLVVAAADLLDGIHV